MYSGVGGFGILLLVCQIVYIFILIYFLVHEGLKIKKQKKAYFKDPWNCFELGLIGVSFGAIAIAVSKEGLGRLVMSSLAENNSKDTDEMSRLLPLHS